MAEKDEGRQEDASNPGSGRADNQAANGAGGQGADNECAESPSTAHNDSSAPKVIESNDKVDRDDALKCEGEISDAHKTINSQEAERDKQLLTLSSALIALALAFAKEAAPFQPIHVTLLLIGLISLVLCIVAVFGSIQVSIYGLEKAKYYWSA